MARRRAGRLVLAAAGTAAALAGGAAGAGASAEPELLARARAIQAEVGARYRALPGRRLAVTEVATTAAFDSYVLVDRSLAPLRVLPGSDGVYFSVCTARARCPYPARRAAWPAAAPLPRRLALELALRTFAETPAQLVIVSLPTRQPVWIVFERKDLLGDVGGAAVEPLVERLTRPRTFRPIPTLPPSRTLYAVRD